MLKTTLTAAAVAAGLLSPAAALEAGDLDDSLKSGSGINILHKVPGCSILDDARRATQMSDPRQLMFEATKDGAATMLVRAGLCRCNGHTLSPRRYTCHQV